MLLNVDSFAFVIVFSCRAMTDERLTARQLSGEDHVLIANREIMILVCRCIKRFL